MNKNPKIATIMVENTVIQLNLDQKPLTKENLKDVIQKVLSQKQKISDAVGSNWFPCGFCNLWVSGKSPLVKLLKKVGKTNELGYMQFDKIELSKAYKTGYNLYLRYNPQTAVEHQSLNFKIPLYQLLQQGLASLGIETQLESRVD